MQIFKDFRVLECQAKFKKGIVSGYHTQQVSKISPGDTRNCKNIYLKDILQNSTNKIFQKPKYLVPFCPNMRKNFF